MLVFDRISATSHNPEGGGGGIKTSPCLAVLFILARILDNASALFDGDDMVEAFVEVDLIAVLELDLEAAVNLEVEEGASLPVVEDRMTLLADEAIALLLLLSDADEDGGLEVDEDIDDDDDDVALIFDVLGVLKDDVDVCLEVALGAKEATEVGVFSFDNDAFVALPATPLIPL